MLLRPPTTFTCWEGSWPMPFRKPVVHMSPKSLLRHPKCVSSIKDFEPKNGFQTVIDDTTVKKADRILFCSGKIYYELGWIRRKNNIDNVANCEGRTTLPLPEKRWETSSKTQGSRSVVGTGRICQHGCMELYAQLLWRDPMEVVARKGEVHP